MEILKFDESGSSSPSRKRSGRGAILVAFVAVVFGASTALASGTLAINNNQGIALDQGVAQTVQCDDAIGVSVISPYNTTEKDFTLDSIEVSGIDTRVVDESGAVKDHCLNKWFNLKIYDSTGMQSEFCVPVDDNGCALDGRSAKLRVITNNLDDPIDKTNNKLTFSFTKKMLTGDNGIVRVQNVTIESSDL